MAKRRQTENETETRREEMISLKKGRPPYLPTSALGGCMRPFFRIDFRTSFLIDFFSILATILVPFWNTFHVFCIPFSSIEFALIFYRFFTDFWYPWSCKKTILTLYSSQKTRNRRFWKFIDLSWILDLVLASFWKHFLIISHTFLPSIFALIF